MPDPIRILVVDDHPAFGFGLIAMLNSRSDFRVIAEASDVSEALARFRKDRPDITLMDLSMPGLNGIDAVRLFRDEDPDCRVIIVTTFDADEDIHRVLEAGAKAYLLKDASRAELEDTIRSVHAGRTVLSPRVEARLAERNARPTLTPREMDILRLIVRGWSNKEIGADLGITETTVKGYLKALFLKLGVADRTQAAITAVQHGIIHL